MTEIPEHLRRRAAEARAKAAGQAEARVSRGEDYTDIVIPAAPTQPAKPDSQNLRAWALHQAIKSVPEGTAVRSEFVVQNLASKYYNWITTGEWEE